MKYPEYEKAFSAARLNKYLKACGGDTMSALTLYRHNVKLCQKCYGIINIFEVVLRNAINEHYKTHFADPDWIRNQLKQGGMLEFHPQRMAVLKTISDLDKNGRYTNDRLVSSVTFGFWTYLFTKKPFHLGGKTILKVFPGKTKGLGQRAIYNKLQVIKDFRNRIAHHEAICFDSSGFKSTLGVRTSYALVIEYIQFIGYLDSQIFYGLDVLPDKIMQKIDAL
ncbi:MAG: Abi family protein [Bacteroidales bacterium]|nr:Abi family protein [Bacteroidales bacterium]